MKYFSTFTGIGGLDWGLERIGAQCVGISEINSSSERIHLRHYNTVKNYGDITKIDPSGLPFFDILTGGFPCQSFSMVGQRNGFTDRRGRMIFYLYDLLVERQPKYAVFENVKGILSHDNGKTFQSVLKLLQAAGYSTRVLLLNSAHYGSAQSRERVFFLCKRGEDFPAVKPWVVDDTKRFRDVRDSCGVYAFLAKPIDDNNIDNYVLVGGWDRVNTLTTKESSSGRRTLLALEDGMLRILGPVEAERLQGFPDGWTAGEARRDRWFALGNAVNCNVSEYLFGSYLPKVWPDFVDIKADKKRRNSF